MADGLKPDEVLRKAREDFYKVYTAERKIRDQALEDLKFVYNVEEGQWPADVRRTREKESRPCLTHNKLRKYVALVANRERDMMPSVDVVPVDDKSDRETARVLAGLIRQIEYMSNADMVYTRAGEYAIACGFGFWRILTKYAEDSLDQDIYIELVENPFSCYVDPRERFAFIREAVPMEQFKEEYPDAKSVDFDDIKHLGEAGELWWEEDKIYIAEYFKKVPARRRLVRLVSPEGMYFDTYMDDKEELERLLDEGWVLVKEREVVAHKIMWYKITGVEVLEEREWPGKYIPVVEVEGDKVNIGGKIYRRSLVRDAKDPQRMYNYWLSAMTEKVALSPKAPFVVTPEEIRGFEDMWEKANIENRPYLLFNPTNLGRPVRQPGATVDSGAMALLNLAGNDIQDTSGIFPSALGQPSNERTAKAIIMRQMRSDMLVYHFPDNLRRAIIKTGKILIDLIPKIYDTERVVRIRGADDSEQLVPINKVVIDENGEIVKINDLSMGKYDVRADIRKYSTRRQETAEFMIQAMQYAPDVAPFLVDLLFKYSDSPGSEEIERRVKAFMAMKLGISPEQLEGENLTDILSAIGRQNTMIGGNDGQGTGQQA